MKEERYEKFLGSLTLLISLPLFVLIAVSVVQGTKQLVSPNPHPQVLLPVPLEKKSHSKPGGPVMDVGLYRVEGELLAISKGRPEQRVFLIRRPSLDDDFSDLFGREVEAYKAVRNWKPALSISLAAGIAGLWITGIGLRIWWAAWFGRARSRGFV